jgi:hypothetical protein
VLFGREVQSRRAPSRQGYARGSRHLRRQKRDEPAAPTAAPTHHTTPHSACYAKPARFATEQHTTSGRSSADSGSMSRSCVTPVSGRNVRKPPCTGP